MSNDIHETLTERGANYGTFLNQATLAGDMKAMIRNSPKWAEMDPDMEEALDMIAVKIARLCTGNPYHHDSWHDIAGYATLVADRIAPK